jgi:hypothetical protein
MRHADRRALEDARKQSKREPVEPPDRKSLITRLFGFWLFHKIFGGGG